MNFLKEIKRAKALIDNAESFIVGIGSGMTASGGLCYTDPNLAKRWYPEYFIIKKQSIFDIMGDFWPNTITDQNATRFWGFWTRHIWHIRFEPKTLPPYADLFTLIHDKDYFIVTTNVDGQLEKSGFPKDRIFAPQGDYALLQCSRHCYDKVFYNHKMVETMINNISNAFEIRQEDIPKCPGCGALLIPNLRCDYNFVETPHIQNMSDYEDFIKSRQDKQIIFLELGVGMNTPGIIRFPFEQMTSIMPNATLIRINRDDVRTVFDIDDKAVFIQDDITKTLYKIVNGISE